MERTWTAALLVIGDEILSGRTQDQNVAQVALWLNEQGIRLAEVRVVPDDAGAIADSYEFSAPTKVSPSKLSREQGQRGVTEISDAERDAVHRMYGPQHGRDS